MTFADASLLRLGVALTGLILVGLWSQTGRRRRLAEFLGGRRAADRLARSDLYGLGIGRTILLGLSGIALATAAAGPRWADAPPPPEVPVKQVILAIDVSASMQATDASPTRLARAVDTARELLDGLDDQEVGLLLFAGKSYPLAPPTRDHDALRFLLTGVTPTIASAQDPGTLLSIGIGEGIALLDRERPTGPRQAGGQAEAHAAVGERRIVLIGDGDTSEPEEEVEKALDQAAEEGIGVHTVGVGTDQGSRMTMPPGTYQLGGPVLDRSGAPGTSRLDEPLLRRVAERGGGRYAHTDREADLRALEADLAQAPTPEPSPGDDAPPWARYDLPFLLALAAAALVLLDSLLDMAFPSLTSLGPREVA